MPRDLREVQSALSSMSSRAPLLTMRFQELAEGAVAVGALLAAIPYVVFIYTDQPVTCHR